MRNRVSAPFLTVVLILVAGSARAQANDGTWMPVGATNYEVVEFRPGTITLSQDGIATVWLRWRLTDKKEEWRQREIQSRKTDGLSIRGYDSFSHKMEQAQYDCRGQRYRALTFVDYNELGTILTSANREPSEAQWAPVVPESVGEAIFRAICSTP